jgi:hypothetical protein
MLSSTWITVGTTQNEHDGANFTGWYRYMDEWRSGGIWPEYRLVGDCVQVR